jgi:hypothetical protein
MRRVLITPMTESELPVGPPRPIREAPAAVPAGIAVPDERRAFPADAGRYRVHGVWKLDRRICDRDPEGHMINGYSDRV